jgi:sugar lactone lactonase YvrE
MIALSAAVLVASFAASAGVNTIGRQSQNEGITAVPAPAKVTVDGDLSEWDWSGRISVFAEYSMRNRYAVEATAMWDKDYLYLGAKWKDPMPLNSTVDPAINPDEGWKADSWQMRIRTDRTLWITVWQFSAKKQSVMHFAYWKDDRSERNGVDTKMLVGAEGSADLGEGVQMAYKADADGKGFSQEMRIPWKLLYRSVPEIKAGNTMRMGCEFLWGDPTGCKWPVHRYADNMQPGKTSREFYWSAVNSWGDITLSDKGNIPLREYVIDTDKIMGTVAVRANIPKDAARFTVVLEDKDGKRVRTLAADRDPADYAVKGADKDGMQTVEVAWDCLNDFGKLVEAGTFKVRGMTHKGVSAEYEMCFYNPGTPPWGIKDGSGAWGSDHSAPAGVTAAGDWTMVSFEVPEGGSGVIGIDPAGQKKWGERRGTQKLAGDDKYVYAYVTHWYTKETICRFEKKTGKTAAFVQNGKDRTYDLTLKEITGEENPGKLTGISVQGGKLAIALDSGKIFILDASSAAVLQKFNAANPGDLAFSRDGKLYGVVDGKVCAIDTASGATKPIAMPGIGKISSLAIDNDGNILIADIGPDSQVKAFSPEGKPVYTCGKKGGRALRGTYDEQAMVKMSSIAVDAKGQVWAVESWNYPRRVSVWGKDGKLVREYLGNTGYSGTGCFLHDQDPSLGYCGPLEFKLDKKAGTWKLNKILWVPDQEKGECFQVSTGTHIGPQRFSADIAGKNREYLYLHDTGNEGTGHVLFMETSDGWKPVSAICTAGQALGDLAHNGQVVKQPEGELAGLNAYDMIIWNDGNGDGKIQRAECEIIPAKKPGDEKKGGETAFRTSNGWGGRIDTKNLTIYVDGIKAFKPVEIKADGAPVYASKSMLELPIVENGDLVPVPEENRLLCLSFKGYAGPTSGMLGIDLGKNAVEWSYPNPYPGVHGSHNATMPKPGLVIGPLKICGVANAGEQAGNVFLLRGNLGQNFIFTTDGLYVGAMFQDTRLPCETLPDKESMLKGMPLDNMTEGSEPFNGWFGKQSDGKIRLTTGWPGQACMILQVNGLDSIRRFKAGEISVDIPTVVKADQENIARAAKKADASVYAIKPILKTPNLDGTLGDWKDIPSLNVSREGLPDKAKVMMAYDAENLYVACEVSDSTPWKNEGKNIARLFKTGDSVDLQLSVNPDAKKHAQPEVGDMRIVFAQLDGKPVAVLMAPVDKRASPESKKSYTSPVGTKVFDRVEAIADAKVKVKVESNRYVVEAALPLKSIGLVPKPGMKLRGDVGFISSDANGMINTARTYWSNKHTNLVSDEPQESWLFPATWGEFSFE